MKPDAPGAHREGLYLAWAGIRGRYLLYDGDGYFDVSVSAETYRPIALRTYVGSDKCGPIPRELDLKMEKE